MSKWLIVLIAFGVTAFLVTILALSWIDRREPERDEDDRPAQ